MAKKTAKKTAGAGDKATAATGGSAVEIKAATPAPAAPWAAFDLDRAFEDFMNRRWLRPLSIEWPRSLSGLLDRQAPSLDIVDGETEIVVRAEVPGVDKKDLDVSIVDRTLTIKGSTRQEKKEERENYFRQEIRSGSFSRSVLLPADVNAAKAASNFKGGVLELRLPKAKTVKPQKVELK